MRCCAAAQASQPLEFIVTMDAEKMITGGNVRATITSTRYVRVPSTSILRSANSIMVMVRAGTKK